MSKKQANKGFTRVTSVLDFVDSAWKTYWYKSVGLEEAERIGRESAAFGTGVHAIAETFLTKGVTEIDWGKYTDRQHECATHILRWLEQVQAKPLHIEAELLDKKLKLIGHCDLIAEIGGNNWLIDFKTSKKVGKGYALQLAAYAHMANEMYDLNITTGAIVRTPSDPTVTPQFEVYEVHDLATYWRVFRCCLEVYQYYNGRGKWKK